MPDELNTDNTAPVVVEARPVNQLPALPQEMSIDQVAARVGKVRELQNRLMKKDIHYGVIPGTPKPTLLKPGAELLCLTFMFDPQYEHEIKQDGVHREITSRCVLYHIPTGNRVASGEGSCSTYESKYAWRKSSPLCPSCGKGLRRSKNVAEYYCWAKMGGCGGKFPLTDKRIKAAGREPNPDIPDAYNTVLKMANKRALTAAILNATAASEIYTMDIEDFPENQVEEIEDEPPQNVSAGNSRAASPEEGGQAREVAKELQRSDSQPQPRPGPPAKPVVAAKASPLMEESKSSVSHEMRAAKAAPLTAEQPSKPVAMVQDRKPISPGQRNLLFAVMRGAKLINGEDAVQAIDWLANHLNTEVIYEDGKTSTENLNAMLGQLYSDQVTELKNAIQQAGKE